MWLGGKSPNSMAVASWENSRTTWDATSITMSFYRTWLGCIRLILNRYNKEDHLWHHFPIPAFFCGDSHENGSYGPKYWFLKKDHRTVYPIYQCSIPFWLVGKCFLPWFHLIKEPSILGFQKGMISIHFQSREFRQPGSRRALFFHMLALRQFTVLPYTPNECHGFRMIFTLW